jgi:hypothetical protein
MLIICLYKISSWRFSTLLIWIPAMQNIQQEFQQVTKQSSNHISCGKVQQKNTMTSHRLSDLFNFFDFLCGLCPIRNLLILSLTWSEMLRDSETLKMWASL